ncbi:MAG: DNA translocase FtsK [Cytophagales bacterium]|nr:DNA translocase FtsK [Cytophagales bacterium]
MGKNTYKSNTFKKRKKEKKKRSFNINFVKDRRFHLTVGIFLLAISIFLAAAFISYLFTGKADQSVVEAFSSTAIKESGLEIDNWFGLMGAISSHYFIYKWFGIASFLIPPFLFVLGWYILSGKQLLSIRRSFHFILFFIFWLSTLFGYITLDESNPVLLSFITGGVGFELALLLNGLMGWGTYVLLLFLFLVFIIYFFNITRIIGFEQLVGNRTTEPPSFSAVDHGPDEESRSFSGSAQSDIQTPTAEENPSESWVLDEVKKTTNGEEPDLELAIENEEIVNSGKKSDEQKLPFEVDEKVEAEKAVEGLSNYDPTLDLGTYQFPDISLLSEYDRNNVQVTKEELEQNKDKIVETLINFKIGISSIKATIGPTVTLYEIVPDAGVKISRIKNLEDDIALSLAALGIRIIAPIPGKGTIGIEVPNKNREMVSVRSVLATEKFENCSYELPVILGKTISNEVYIADLAKMPHLLMAGATGQGKSVGLNVLIASLVYKRHPSQLKFVMVDPKKVELTLFNKIERHYLAMLPDSEEPIITENKKVIYTLNSLCIEMDNRLLLLKDAGCRNLKEYNGKFVKRLLNPEKGHRYMPYIVLIIDELADLMVTSGKEIETPVARLAAVSRATGIHLVLATQRPSVNVITGIIKANFPARLSFRVTSKIDSRTILDSGGAEQLVGLGDMLYSHGSDLVRLQGPYIDTAEVEKICDFIGAQRGYESAYILPEFVGEDTEGPGTVDLGDRDSMFDEAARLIVRHQQGSTSLIQRKLKLGYNRAGRLIDQLEAAGIVGPFEGSKAREVLVQDEYVLEQLLSELDEKN